tara:strand:- start:2235 stop:2510 length:276 start_codon:yes stop_codon:yes gene_type:complete
MSNPFQDRKREELNGSVTDMVPVTPADGADNVGTGNIAIGLYITGAGNVSFHNIDGTTRTIAVPDNFYLVCSVKRVLATGTTATGIHAIIA